MSDKIHLSPKQLAERWNKSEHCIKKRRIDGKGPDYIRLGDSPQAPVLYPLESVIEYERRHLVKTQQDADCER